MTTIVGLCLEPLDVLFFRDGRPFTGAERSVSGLPLPQTVTGAVRTALLRLAGCDFRRLGEQVKDGASFTEAVKQSCTSDYHWIGHLAIRGPWLARRKSEADSVEVLVPVPAILHREKRDRKKLHRLSPLHDGQLPGLTPPEDEKGLRPLWLKHLPATESVSGYFTRRGLERFLQDSEVEAEDVLPQDDLFSFDYRTGIAISPDRLVATESQIFGRGFLALKENVFLYSELVLPNEVLNGAFLDMMKTLPLGGEGRHVIVRPMDQPFSWPQATPKKNRKPLLLLTTPCAFQAGWKPRALEGHLVSAAVPGSLVFSGWDLARGGPKATRFAVPAGSVYLLDSLPTPPPDSLAETEEEGRQGWGCYLKGVWTDE